MMDLSPPEEQRAIREAIEADRVAKAEAAADYRVRSNFVRRDPGQHARMANALASEWQGALKQLDADTRRNDLHHGLAFEPNGENLQTLVLEYLTGFGWNGVTMAELAEAVGRDRRRIRPVLEALMASGDVVFDESPTRGGGTPRKLYKPVDGAAPVRVSDNLAETLEAAADVYFADTADAHEAAA